MKIERPEKVEAFSKVLRAAMDTLSTGETFEVPFTHLRYVCNLVHYRNKEGMGKFKVVTAPVIESDILTDKKTVHVVREK